MVAGTEPDRKLLDVDRRGRMRRMKGYVRNSGIADVSLCFFSASNTPYGSGANIGARKGRQVIMPVVATTLYRALLRAVSNYAEANMPLLGARGFPYPLDAPPASVLRDAFRRAAPGTGLDGQHPAYHRA
jgi:hypothetical protein